MSEAKLIVFVSLIATLVLVFGGLSSAKNTLPPQAAKHLPQNSLEVYNIRHINHDTITVQKGEHVGLLMYWAVHPDVGRDRVREYLEVSNLEAWIDGERVPNAERYYEDSIECGVYVGPACWINWFLPLKFQEMGEHTWEIQITFEKEHCDGFGNCFDEIHGVNPYGTIEVVSPAKKK